LGKLVLLLDLPAAIFISFHATVEEINLPEISNAGNRQEK